MIVAAGHLAVKKGVLVRWPIKVLVVSIVLIANVSILWWRYEHSHPEIKGVGPIVAARGAAQANTVIAWRKSPSVPLTRKAIREFVDGLKWGDCAPISSNARGASPETLSPKAQEALRRTVAGLIEVYSQNDPAQLYDFMTDNHEELSPSTVATLQRLLVTDGEMAEERVTSLSPRDLFITIAQRIHYNARWQSLVADSACATLWKTEQARQVVIDESPLGAAMAGAFKNQTRFHHLFQCAADPSEKSRGESTYVDFQFVVKHDRRLMSEPSPYHIRLLMHPATEAWHPVEMVHVATISGNSPPILF